MTKEPEALRLASLLGKELTRTVRTDILWNDSANELRRLHEVNADLLEALKDALLYLHRVLPDEALVPHRAAVQKATGETE